MWYFRRSLCCATRGMRSILTNALEETPDTADEIILTFVKRYPSSN